MQSFNFKKILSLSLLIIVLIAGWFFWNRKSNLENQISGIFISMSANEIAVSSPTRGQRVIKFDEQTAFALINVFKEESLLEKSYLLNEGLPDGISIDASNFKNGVAGKILVMLPSENVSGTVASFEDNMLTILQSSGDEFKVKTNPMHTTALYSGDDGSAGTITLNLIKPGLLIDVTAFTIEDGEIVATWIDLRSSSKETEIDLSYKPLIAGKIIEINPDNFIVADDNGKNYTVRTSQATAYRIYNAEKNIFEDGVRGAASIGDELELEVADNNDLEGTAFSIAIIPRVKGDE